MDHLPIMPATPNIIDQLGTSWKLDVAAVATFSTGQSTFGYLSYVGDPDKPWLCDNVNTLHLASKGILPDGVLPDHVCIRPKYDGECGDYDLNGYPVPEDKCLCADPECPHEFDLFVECNDCRETDTQTISKGGDPGLDCPENPSYTMTSVLCNQTLKATWYCCSGDWRADITVNGTYCMTVPLGPPAERCPLVIGPGISDCDYLYVDCPVTTPPIDQCCCPDDPVAGTLYLTGSMASGCACAGSISATLTYNGTKWTGTAATVGCLGNVPIELTCTGGTCLWVLGLDYTACGGSADVLSAVTTSCNPFILTFGGDEDAGADPCCDTTPYRWTITVQD